MQLPILFPGLRRDVEYSSLFFVHFFTVYPGM